VENHFHKPSLFFQMPPAILAGFTLVCGIFPVLLERSLGAFHVAGLHADPHTSLKLWHGFASPAFQISCGILIAGMVLYAFARKDRWRFACVPVWLRFDDAFNHGVRELPAFAGRITRFLGTDHPVRYAPILLGAALLWIGPPLLGELPSSLPQVPEAGEWLMGTLAALLLVAAGLCLLFARSWKAQVILVGSIGFLITFYFVLYRAPDLALTQILVEAASLVLLLIFILRFPSLRRSPVRLPAGRAWTNFGLAAGTGLLMFTLTLLLAGRPAPERLGDAYLEASLPMAKGTNAVNTILIDFRGFDTLLEIGVLVIATLGVIGLLRRRKEDPHA
jgi:multisubunit Na+/H+ antiporter MnhB subunit